MSKRKRYLGDLELHEAPHILLRTLHWNDQGVAGVSCQENETCAPLMGQWVAMVLKSSAERFIRLQDAPAIPVTYDPKRAEQNPNVKMVAYGRWHVNTDLDGVKFSLLDSNQQATTKLYWTRPVYVIIEEAVFQGTEKWYPVSGQGRPDGLSQLEATAAYLKLREGAKRAIRETQQVIDNVGGGVGRYRKPRAKHNADAVETNGAGDVPVKSLPSLFVELSFHEWRQKKAEAGLHWVEETWGELADVS